MLAGLFTRGQPMAASSAMILKDGDYAPARKANLDADPLAQAMQTARLGQIIGQRARWADHPEFQSVFNAAVQAVDENFALVPEGIVSLALSVFDAPGQPEVDCQTSPFLLARYPVTNEEYQHFVDSGAYEQLEMWPEEIWPYLVSFKDQTGQYGPRFWQSGRHDRRLARHPVVGVSFYEAAAYAAWVGFRLPTEPEWQMAASWRVRSAAHVHRRYPWGDGFELNRCNVWSSGHGGTLPVDACPLGAAPNGVRQLIGNTWEWTHTEFQSIDREGRPVVGNTLMKSIRGGAYDTYFAWQATSAFRSGLEVLSRVHNCGFRCALDLQAN